MPLRNLWSFSPITSTFNLYEDVTLWKIEQMHPQTESVIFTEECFVEIGLVGALTALGSRKDKIKELVFPYRIDQREAEIMVQNLPNLESLLIKVDTL